MRDSVLLGAGGGAAAGAGVGFAAGGGRSNTATLIGGATGAIAGGLLGYLLHQSKETSQERNATARDDKNARFPFVTKPEVRSIAA